MYQTYEGMSVYAEKFKIPTKPNLESASTNLPSYDSPSGESHQFCLRIRSVKL